MINSAWELYDVEKLKAAIAYAYTGAGQGATSWAKVNQAIQGMSDAQVYELCTTLNSSGVITNSYNALYPTPVNGTLGTAIRVSEKYAADTAASTAAQALNSNSITSAAQVMELNIPANAVKTGQQVAFQEGATVVKTASKAEVALGHLATGIIGTGIGLKLGVWVDGLLYNANPDFWDSHNMSEMDPQTWGDNIIGQGLLQWADYPQAPVMVDSDGQVYADENMFALMAKYMAGQDFFNTQASEASQGDLPDSKFFNASGLPDPVYLSPNLILCGENHEQSFYTTSGSSAVYTYWDGHATLYTCSKNPYVFVEEGIYNATFNAIQVQAADGTEMYVFQITVGILEVNPTAIATDPGADYRDTAYMILYGDLVEEGREGVHKYDDVPIGITPSMTLSDILDLLRPQYPDIFDKRLKNSVLQPDGTITDKYYLPISIPSGGTDPQPESKPEDNGDPDPENKEQTRRIIETQTPVDDSEPENDDTGSGDTPALVAPTGAAEALYAIYNPTLQQVKDLGAWLWSTNFIDQILKMFSSPMEAIISLHKVYGTPHTATNPQNIKVGYLDSGVSSKVVDEQYITVDCGTVNVREYYAGVFDYNPFSEIHLYLPFIGIVPLDIADVMRGAVNIVYHIDVITGAVLAEVKVMRDGAGGVIYQYTGSCAEHFPLSAGSYVGVVAGMAGIAAGVVGSVASGGAMAPALLGAGAGIGAMHTSINKSGNFTANAGAMGIKIPYIIISRPQSAMASNFQHMSGLGANTYCTLASCSGYVRVKHIHLENVSGATREDLEAIESRLKKGVII